MLSHLKAFLDGRNFPMKLRKIIFLTSFFYLNFYELLVYI